MELLKATWDEFDLKAGEWHLPAERTKTDAAIRIPLSPWVVSILKEQKARGHNAYVFPVLRIAPGKTTGYMGETTLNHALYMLQSDLEPFTVHDLRRTACTHLAALGVAPYIAEMCLNHTVEKDFAGDFVECRQESAAVAAGHALRLVHRARQG